jgi:hypothetical protein
MSAAQQDQIIVAMSLSPSLAGVVSGAAWTSRFYVADFSDQSITVDNFDRTLWKRAPVPGSCKQSFGRRISRTCQLVFEHIQISDDPHM